MQHLGKGALRIAKNYTKGYSDTQAKVREATSNDPWGPTGAQMNEIAQMTYNQNDFVEIMEMLDKRLNDKGKNWRHVLKSLEVLDYCLHSGSENVVIYFRDNIYIVKTLKEFQYIDDDGKDQGANVRQKAKDITNLLVDEDRLRTERRSRSHMRDRMMRGDGQDERDERDESLDENRHRRARNGSNARTGKDDDELKRAIEESKRSFSKEQGHVVHQTTEERDLQEAIRLSEEEETKRSKALAESNASALFDDQNQAAASTNPFPLLDTSYGGGLQPQFTQMQPQIQPQYTFNPYQQQAEQEAMQAEFLRQQQAWQAEQLRQQQEQEMFLQQQLLLQQQQLQQQQQQQLQQQQYQQALMAQPTGFGFNNPFAAQQSATPAVPPMPSFTPQPSASSNSPIFTLQGTYANSNSTASTLSSPSPASISPAPASPSASLNSRRRPDRPENEHLANLFANRDDGGTDTFGNFGQLRYGHTDAGRVVAQRTGVPANNPFAQQQASAERPFFDI